MQEYTIDSDWRFRSTVLTPMFIETQASQSALQTRTQEGSLSARGAVAGQIRATQQQYDFTPTPSAGSHELIACLLCPPKQIRQPQEERTVKFLETGSSRVVSRAGEGTVGTWCLMGVGLSLRRWESSAEGWWWVVVVQLYQCACCHRAIHLELVKTVNLMLYILYY